MLLPILLTLAIVVIVFLVIAARQPSTFRVTRTATIDAPASVVFAQVDDFHRWEAWSPWAKLDPAMTQTYAGPPAGAGAAYSWVGNSKVGAGSMTLTESHPHDRISIRLDFLKPFAATNTADFTFRSEGDRTVVTWSMSGEKNFVCKAVSLFMNMDKMVGGQFEEGLAKLRSVSASLATARP